MRRAVLVLAVSTLPSVLLAQHVHTEGMSMASGTMPTQSGQDAYAAIAEIVRILQADSATDWSKVDIEALRRHLVDMNRVTLASAVRQSEVPGGLQMDVTGDAATAAAIRRMVHEHAAALDQVPGYSASAGEIPGGVRLTVVARNVDDARQAAMIRGLGFSGLLTVGAHHAAHHLALARGEPMTHM